MNSKNNLNLTKVVPEGSIQTSKESVYEFDNDPRMHTLDDSTIDIKYRAAFDYKSWTPYFTCECCVDPRRKYLHVHENGIEMSSPGIDCFQCAKEDFARKYYFDRGPFNIHTFCRMSQCIEGPPVLVSNEIQYVCFGQPCSPEINQCFDCHFPQLFGERVRVQPSQVVLCCIPTKSNVLFNCFSLCGPQSGQPMPCCMYNFAHSLKLGEAEALVKFIETTRSTWMERLKKSNQLY